jgi:streptomycin 6-kinase
VPVRLANGGDAVLKVNFPEPESEHEADALDAWDGRGAARLLARNDACRALLVERCRPGTSLWGVDEEEAAEIAAGVLLRIWRPASPGHRFRPLGSEALRWAEELPVRWRELGRAFERSLLDEAVAFLREAVAAPGEPVLLHQDLHGGNILRAEREPWLAIDPKPLFGEREFDTASLLRDRRDELVRDPDPSRRMRRRLDFLSERLGLDRERMRGWGIAHALAWGFDGNRVLPSHVACARLLADTRAS